MLRFCNKYYLWLLIELRPGLSVHVCFLIFISLSSHGYGERGWGLRLDWDGDGFWCVISIPGSCSWQMTCLSGDNKMERRKGEESLWKNRPPNTTPTPTTVPWDHFSKGLYIQAAWSDPPILLATLKASKSSKPIISVYLLPLTSWVTWTNSSIFWSFIPLPFWGSIYSSMELRSYWVLRSSNELTQVNVLCK